MQKIETYIGNINWEQVQCLCQQQQVTEILNERVFAMRWHASLRKFFEWSSFRFGTMPGTAGDSLSGMGELQYTGVCYRLAGLIFSWEVIYRFYRYRFYATVITSVCTEPRLKPTYNGCSAYWEQPEQRYLIIRDTYSFICWCINVISNFSFFI